MNKKVVMALYMVIATILDIILTLVLMAALFFACYLTMRYVFHTEAGVYVGVPIIVAFVGGLLLGFILFTKITAWITERLNLTPYLTINRKKKKQATQGEGAERNYVLPDSAKDDIPDE